MGYTIPSKQEAEEVARVLTARGLQVEGEGRQFSHVEAKPYPGAPLWGVVVYWRYTHRPDLPEFNDGFVWDAKALAARCQREETPYVS